MITVVLCGAVFLAIAITTWAMLRTEFNETFHQFSACSAAMTDRTALMAPGATSTKAEQDLKRTASRVPTTGVSPTAA